MKNPVKIAIVVVILLVAGGVWWLIGHNDLPTNKKNEIGEQSGDRRVSVRNKDLVTSSTSHRGAKEGSTDEQVRYKLIQKNVENSGYSAKVFADTNGLKNLLSISLVPWLEKIENDDLLDDKWLYAVMEETELETRLYKDIIEFKLGYMKLSRQHEITGNDRKIFQDLVIVNTLLNSFVVNKERFIKIKKPLPSETRGSLLYKRSEIIRLLQDYPDWQIDFSKTVAKDVYIKYLTKSSTNLDTSDMEALSRSVSYN